jgi:hypothetical protein
MEVEELHWVSDSVSVQTESNPMDIYVQQMQCAEWRESVGICQVTYETGLSEYTVRHVH